MTSPWGRLERRGRFAIWARGGLPSYRPTWADIAALEVSGGTL